MVDPPLFVGAVQSNSTLVPPACAVADRPVGAPGTVVRVDSVTAELAAELPVLLTALTWNVYSVLGSRFEIVKVTAVELVSVHAPPAVEPSWYRYWYSVIGVPPSSVGAVHASTAVVRVVVTDRLVGALGTVVVTPVPMTLTVSVSSTFIPLRVALTITL